MRRLSSKFRSIKNPHPSDAKKNNFVASSSSTPISRHQRQLSSRSKRGSMWSVYLIVSTRLPRTYVGVTTDFARRLKQHNGELKGGAKASSVGRPWVLACIIRGFKDQSEACEFESKWKILSRKMPSKKRKEEDASYSLLQHREEALDRVKVSFDCTCLRIEWQSCAS